MLFDVDCCLGSDTNGIHDQCHSIEEGTDMADDGEERTASYEEESGESVDDLMAIDAWVSLAHKHQCTRARSVGALAIELRLPDLPNILCHFLHSQLNPTDTRNPENISFHECPLYKGKIHVYNSACSTFFAPSDLSGIYGMHHEYICLSPMWRNAGPQFDCVFIVTDPQVEGMYSLDVTHVLCFFFIQVSRDIVSMCYCPLVRPCQKWP
ncbi:hypothetical protein PISMIDRAFT_105843 [Pisolithus microcarpus 441]|uniref:Uncharacterized protein n=1 Tax=Pisolithus microcarpus 441 TaxID=765257 RepID=A0A0C9ZDA3_9AGAM|nr:hypothetical protein PISMIDRAFT_105843 [Pisolithus microcarpus 441]